MDSTINLLPEKDKLLKRTQRKALAEMVEMTKPQDRIFRERVVRMEGLLAFFKSIFRRAPKLTLPKVKTLIPPAPPKPLVGVPSPAAPVTKLETMQDHMPGLKLPPKPVHIFPPHLSGGSSVSPRVGNFFSKFFNRAEKPTLPVGIQRPTLVVPLPPAKTFVPSAPAPVKRAPSWTPPPPPPPTPPRVSIQMPVVPAPKSSLSAASFPPPIPTRSRPAPAADSVTQAKPILGSSLNVNLVPEEYQPESSGQDRLLAGIFVGGAMFIVAAVALGLSFYQQKVQNKVQDVDDQLLVVNEEINQRERDDLGDALVLQQRTNDVKRVLDQHVYWDVFFQKLEGITLPNVAYTSMSVDVAGSVTLAAQAKTYNDVGAQLLTYQKAKDFITDVTITGATKDSSAPSAPTTSAPSASAPTTEPTVSKSLVSFSVSLRVNPAIFYRR